MSIHPSGNGTGWTNVEAVDVDQPHGKDYLYSQHVAKGIRKRMNHEHSTFADATVGGIHKPGGAAVLGECDGTPGAADGTYRGHGVVWDMSSRLWCSTAAAGASTSGDFTVITLHPDLQWAGGDVTWAGAHEFDASVDISGNVAIEGDVTIEGHLLIDGSFDCSDVYAAGDLSVGGNLSLTDVSFDGGGDFSLADGTEIGAPVHYAQNKVIQDVNAQTGANTTGTTLTATTNDDDIPQNDEGLEVLTLAITPKSTTNKLKIDVVAFVESDSGTFRCASLFQGATAAALASGQGNGTGAVINSIKFTYYMDAGTTSETTFKVRVSSDGTTVAINGTSGGRIYGGKMITSITITEINTL